MRIVIFSGGTGSIALQCGFYNLLEANLDGIDIKILVNAYDNGLSTGDVRRVMNGKVLGPSDVRKNQETRVRLSNPGSPWLRMLSTRFSASPGEAERFCITNLSGVIGAMERTGEVVSSSRLLFGAIEQFFRSATALQIAYKEFSLANIIYAGLASANDNSLRAAARIMSGVLSIPDNVLLNDDRSLFLGAITASGKRVTDEGSIVCWGNETDPFVDLFFTDVDGAESEPELCLEAWEAIVEAELIVMASGTQWSSLIPTYASRGFKAAIKQSKADVLMIMNRTPDRDSPGQTASDLIHVLVPRYFEAGRVHVLTDANAHPRMQTLSHSALGKVASFTRAPLSKALDSPDKHDPQRLAEAVGRIFFREHLDSDLYFFDYDDTLVAREKKWPKSSQFNIEGLASLNRLTEVAICSGNTIRAIDLESAVPAAPDDSGQCKPLKIFADGGVNEYSYPLGAPGEVAAAGPQFVRCICNDALLPPAGVYSAYGIVEALLRVGVPSERIDIRGGALVAIRPVESAGRDALLLTVRSLLEGTGLEIRERGKTTLEVCRSNLSKASALKHLYRSRAGIPKITYVGDELESGNDWDVKELATQQVAVKCLHVDSPPKTAFFIATLLAYLVDNVRT